MRAGQIRLDRAPVPAWRGFPAQFGAGAGAVEQRRRERHVEPSRLARLPWKRSRGMSGTIGISPGRSRARGRNGPANSGGSQSPPGP